MRDIIFTILMSWVLVEILRTPFIGIMMWIWSSLLAPTVLVYGFATSLRFHFMIAIATISSFFFHREYKAKNDAILSLCLAFFLWTCITTLLSPSQYPFIVDEWVKFFKIIIFCIFCRSIIDNKHRFVSVCLGAILALGYYAILEGAKFILSGGGHKIVGPAGTILEDNNQFAMAFVTVIPLLIFLIRSMDNIWIKRALLGTLLFFVIGVIGTFSRGSLIGLVVIGYFYIFSGKRKLLNIVLASFIILIAVQIAPDAWFNRMDTIGSATGDESFLGRLMSWKMHTLAALDHPFVGVGFRGLLDPTLWHYYALDFDQLSFIQTPDPLLVDKILVAHSIYFQVLGDHGFFGLILYLFIFYLSIKKLSWVIKQTKRNNCIWYYDAAYALRTSLISFAVCGAALSVPYFDLLFFLFALTGVVIQLYKEEINKKENLVDKSN